MKSRKTFDIIVSVLIAMALWAYVINVLNPVTTITFKDVPVRLINAEELRVNKLALAEDADYSVDVDLSGARDAFSDISAGDIYATADLSGLSLGQNYVPVNVQVPGKLEVSEVRLQKIAVFVEELVTEEKPVKTVYPALDDDKEIYILSCDTKPIAVSGAKSRVEKVSELLIEVSPEGLDIDTYRLRNIKPLPVDAAGAPVENLTTDPETVSVTAAVFKTKTVALKTRTVGKPAFNAKVASAKIPRSVVIKGPSEALGAVSFVSAEDINIEGISSGITVKLDLDIPNGVMLSDKNSKLTASIALQNIGSVTFDYAYSEVVFKNLAEGLEAAIVGGHEEIGMPPVAAVINVTATGPLDAVKSLTKENASPALNLSSIAAGRLTLELGTVYGEGDLNFTIDPAYLDILVVATTHEGEGGQEEGAGPGGV